MLLDRSSPAVAWGKRVWWGLSAARPRFLLRRLAAWRKLLQAVAVAVALLCLLPVASRALPPAVRVKLQRVRQQVANALVCQSHVSRRRALRCHPSGAVRGRPASPRLAAPVPSGGCKPANRPHPPCPPCLPRRAPRRRAPTCAGA